MGPPRETISALLSGKLQLFNVQHAVQRSGVQPEGRLAEPVAADAVKAAVLPFQNPIIWIRLTVIRLSVVCLFRVSQVPGQSWWWRQYPEGAATCETPPTTSLSGLWQYDAIYLDFSRFFRLVTARLDQCPLRFGPGNSFLGDSEISKPQPMLLISRVVDRGVAVKKFRNRSTDPGARRRFTPLGPSNPEDRFEAMWIFASDFFDLVSSFPLPSLPDPLPLSHASAGVGLDLGFAHPTQTGRIDKATLGRH
jgi:hypothetical protein